MYAVLISDLFHFQRRSPQQFCNNCGWKHNSNHCAKTQALATHARLTHSILCISLQPLQGPFRMLQVVCMWRDKNCQSFLDSRHPHTPCAACARTCGGYCAKSGVDRRSLACASSCNPFCGMKCRRIAKEVASAKPHTVHKKHLYKYAVPVCTACMSMLQELGPNDLIQYLYGATR